MTLIDPYDTTPQFLQNEVIRVVKHFNQYIEICENKENNNIFTNLKNVLQLQWFVSDRPHQSPSDGYNCSVYVIYYTDDIGKEKGISPHFNPDEYREHLSNILIKKSENMTDICLYCIMG
ncbi:hypothetical protein TSAR_006817 [Trichomalopsis sarcophagae]|uniref:Uncharacterized protein n=1 Tax=Trichomalopsis sarcophagae TaxID=543379 RepID=A0A232F2G9_9HYME|nr:hypothetical protein TSAR_006817 [Trichomalopsis sarcophagae]